MGKHSLQLFLTIDTEVWNNYDDIEQNILTSVYGKTSEGEYGLRYIIDQLNAYDLKASFFVEPLFSEISGQESLCKIINCIQETGQDVQLHIHTEWLGRMKNSPLPGKSGMNMNSFTRAQQSKLIEYSKTLLEDCGSEKIRAFRAGNFGANLDTLEALAEAQISFDSSYNYCYLDSDCDIKTQDPLLHPTLLNGVVEFPVGFFRDYPGHYRPLHLTACSFREFRNILLQAFQMGWFSVVIVLHSFELLDWHARRGLSPSLDNLMLNRFEKFFRFLSTNRDKIETKTFSEVDSDVLCKHKNSKLLSSNIFDTALRVFEQSKRKIA